MIGIGATVFKRAVIGGQGFSPLALFANGEQGTWFDPSDLSTLFQNSNGTTAVAVGDPVGYMADKSGNGNHVIQATSAKRPTLRESGGLYYLEFDGAQGLISSDKIDFTGTDSMTVCSGARKNVDTTANVCELTANVASNVGTFRLAAITGNSWRYLSRGTASIRNAAASGFVAPITNVLTGISDIGDDSLIIRVDGTQEDSSTDNQGLGNYGDYKLNIGARNNGGGLQLTGRIYSFIARGVTSTAGEIDSLEAFVAKKTGITL